MKPATPVFALAALALAGCQQQKQAAAAQGPDAKPGIEISDGRLVLPAVKGNPGAVYFNLRNASGKVAVLSAVSVDGAASAEMHETSGGSMSKADRMDIPPAAKLAFEPGGLHVMAFDLKPLVKPGDTAEMTLTFADGDKVSAPVKVEAAGMGGMEHMR